MKFVLALILSLVCSVTGAIPRIPRVSEGFAKRMASLDTNNCVRVEGQWSNPDSSVNKRPDIFLVWSVKPDGARALHMGPFKTDSNGVEQPPRFTDTVTGEEKVLPYQTVDDRANGGDYYHHGILILGDDRYYVVVAYEGDMQHPIVSITWGKGSDLLNPGETIDVFEDVATETITEQRVGLEKISGQEGVPDGVYLFVDSPKPFGEFTLMESSNLNNSWKKSKITPYIIYGDSVIYKIDIEKIGFFKVE